MALSDITLEAVPSIGEVSPEDWDACASPGKACNGHGVGTSSGLPGDSLSLSKPAYNPFVSHAFLSAVEKSGSATVRTGWGPRHLVAKIGGRVAGVVPCYLKSHSQGEYVFDRGWADAYERAGGRYYPKLQVSVPFTPATGPRLLIRDGDDHERITPLALDRLAVARIQGGEEVVEGRKALIVPVELLVGALEEAVLR